LTDVSTEALQAATHEVDDLVDAIELYYERGWTDGLPIVPPTPEHVAACIAACGRAPDDIIDVYPTRKRVIRVEKLAINAVMAGCKPEYFPVVLAIVEAMTGERFGLHGANASTGSMTLGFVVNGPIRNRIGMNYRGNVLGPGNRANSTIGRAIRLIQINVMGSVPGAGNQAQNGLEILDRSTMGHPAKYAGFHIPENEEDYPSLRPLHVELGYAPDDDVVTVFGAGGSLQITAHEDNTADAIVETVAHALLGTGKLTNRSCVLVVPPECAEYFVQDGWTKADIRQALFEKTTRSVAWLKRNGWAPPGTPVDPRGGEVLPGEEDMPVAVAATPDDILVVVAGGPAGAFLHAIVPYSAMTESRLIHSQRRRPDATNGGSQ
jgi:hypothetical protein